MNKVIKILVLFLIVNSSCNSEIYKITIKYNNKNKQSFYTTSKICITQKKDCLFYYDDKLICNVKKIKIRKTKY